MVKVTHQSVDSDLRGYGNIKTGLEKLNELESSLAEIAQQAKNVKSFGAKGDGVTDDTQAIQDAVTYCSQNNVPLYFPIGNYYVTKTINGVLDKDLTMFSTSFVPKYGWWENINSQECFIRIDTSFVGNYVFDFPNTLGTASLSIRNMNIYNSVQTRYNNFIPTVGGIHAVKTICDFYNVAVRGMKYAVHIHNAGLSKFENLYLSASIVCLYAYYSSDSRYKNMYINTTSFMSSFITPSTDINNPSLVGIMFISSNAVIDGGKVEWVPYGIVCMHSVTITNITFDVNTLCYITVINDSTITYPTNNILISNNRFIGCKAVTGTQPADYNSFINVFSRYANVLITNNTFAKSINDANCYSNNANNEAGPYRIMLIQPDILKALNVTFTNNLTNGGYKTQFMQVNHVAKLFVVNNVIGKDITANSFIASDSTANTTVQNNYMGTDLDSIVNAG